MLDEKAVSNIVSKLSSLGATRVFIQVPEGMKMSILEFTKKLEKRLAKKGVEFLVSCDPCYGACDLKDREARDLGCDLLVHIGHTELNPGRKPFVPVIYEEYSLGADPIRLMEKHANLLKPCKKLCLVTTAQYIHLLEKTKKYLESKGKTVYIGSPKKAVHPGQVLGCDYSAAEPFDRMVDCFLYMGTGRFHPIGLALRVTKPVLVLDFELGTLENMHRERDMLLRIRAAQVEKAMEAQNFGIMVSTKPGQENLGTALKAKKRLLGKGKDAWILVMDEITPEKLLGMKLDVLVNCACPRLSEDFRQFRKPILNPEDVEKL